jgi:exodeoxyribonuclease VII small subunit
MTKKESLAPKKRHPTDTQSAIKKDISETTEKISFDFEASLNELEKLVEALEQGDLTLEQSLQDFERGINLTRSCQNALTEAQQKVKILLQNNDHISLKDFN